MTVDRQPGIGWREFYEFDVKPLARDNGATLASEVAPVFFMRGLHGKVEQFTVEDIYGFVDYESSGYMSIQLIWKRMAGTRLLYNQFPINGRFKVRKANPNQQIHPNAEKPDSG